jgi:hypothetical protein
MGTEKERLELEQKLAWYRELAREYPDGEIALVIRDFIDELERQIHSPEKPSPRRSGSPT